MSTTERKAPGSELTPVKFSRLTRRGVLLGLSIFALSLGVIGMVWLNRYRELVSLFLG